MIIWTKRFPVRALESALRETKKVFPFLGEVIVLPEITSEHPDDFFILRGVVKSLAERSINPGIPELLTSAAPKKIIQLFFRDGTNLDFGRVGGSLPIGRLELLQEEEKWIIEVEEKKKDELSSTNEKARQSGWARWDVQ